MMSSVPPPECVNEPGMQAGGVVEVFRRDDTGHALAVARQVAAMLKGWRAAISDADIRSGLEIEQLRSTPVEVAVEREAAAGPAGEYLGHAFTVVVRVNSCPPKFKTMVLDKLPNEVEGLQIICEV
jgi:hypothetical protein